eukprot:9142893-Pyramimonas_sp.AAC.1
MRRPAATSISMTSKANAPQYPVCKTQRTTCLPNDVDKHASVILRLAAAKFTQRNVTASFNKIATEALIIALRRPMMAMDVISMHA